MAYLEELLRQRLAVGFEAVAGEPVDPVVRRSERADFQSDAALGLSRRLAGDPRAVAERVVAATRLGDVCDRVEISGPGFINLTVADSLLGELLIAAQADERLGVEPDEQPEIVTVDYSAPNAAKEMHVGHLRSTIIGDAAVRLLQWQGHTVVRQNHIGEWGTPFGMLIEHLLDVGEAEAAHELSVGDLNGFYRAARGKFDADPAFRDRARRRVVALQAGEQVTRRLWQTLVAESKKYFGTVYERLGVRLTDDDYIGESFYNDQLGVDPREVELHGLDADEQVVGHLSIAHPHRDQLGHRGFLRCQPARVEIASACWGKPAGRQLTVATVQVGMGLELAESVSGAPQQLGRGSTLSGSSQRLSVGDFEESALERQGKGRDLDQTSLECLLGGSQVAARRLQSSPDPGQPGVHLELDPGNHRHRRRPRPAPPDGGPDA